MKGEERKKARKKGEKEDENMLKQQSDRSIISVCAGA